MKLKIIKKFDIFGKQILLRFNNIDRHKTTSGGIVTLLILVFVGFFIFNILLEMINMTKPEVIFNQQYVQGVDIYNVTDNNFMLAMGMEDSNFAHFMDEKIYRIEATQIIARRSNITNQMVYQYSDITLERCTKDSFKQEDVSAYYLRQPYTDLYCLKDNQGSKLEFGGDFDLEYFSMMQFQVFRCKGDNCIDRNDPNNYQNYYQYPKFALYFNDVLTDPKVRDSPFTTIGRDLYFITSETLQKQITVYMIQNYIESQEGWLVTQDLTTSQLGFSQYQELSLLTTADDDLMFTVAFRLEKKKENKWSRKYITLSQGLSQIGGIYQALLAFGYICLFPISQFELNRKLMNQIFSFENSSINRKEKQKTSSHKQLNVQTDSIIQKNNDEEDSKSAVVVKDIRSFISHNNIQRDKTGTFQILSQNSLTVANGRSQLKIENNTHSNTPNNGILFKDLLQQQKIQCEQSPQKIQQSCESNFIQQQLNFLDISLSPKKKLNLTPQPNSSPPPHQQSQFTQQIFGVQGGGGIIQKNLSPKFPNRQNKKKSQTLFINKLTVNNLPVGQRSMHFKQTILPIKQKQLNPLEESTLSPMIINRNTMNSINKRNDNNNSNSNNNSPIQSNNKKIDCSNNTYNDSIINKIDKANNNNGENVSKKELKELKKIQKKNNFMLKNINRKFLNYFKVTANRIKLSFWEYFRYFICPPRSLRIKKQQMSYGMEKLYHHLDIVYVLKKLTEIDKLKILLLNDQQIKLFEYLPRPKILTNQNQQEHIQIFNFLYEDKRTEIERAYDAYESFKAITQEGYIQSAQDRKLLSMVDPHLFDLFEDQNIKFQANLEHLDEINIRDDTQNNNNNNNGLVRSFISPKNNRVTGQRCSIFQIQNENNINQVNPLHIQGIEGCQIDKDQFREETLEDTEKGSSIQESIYENNKQIILKMQSFQRKLFSNTSPNEQTNYQNC